MRPPGPPELSALGGAHGPVLRPERAAELGEVALGGVDPHKLRLRRRVVHHRLPVERGVRRQQPEQEGQGRCEVELV